MGMLVKRRAFERIKDRFQCSGSYRVYMDLLSNEETRDVEYKVQDIRGFARTFYHYERKDVCRFLDIDIEDVPDMFVAELAAHYSLFHGDRIDEVEVASVLLEGGEEIVKGTKVIFYVKIMEVLRRLQKRMSSGLKRRLAMFLRRLVFYSAYTRSAGMLINALGYESMEFPRRTDYHITILGSCGHPRFGDYLVEYPWSISKELGLVYGLRFYPALGTAYRWKLEEIVGRVGEKVSEEAVAVCVELVVVLREFIEESGHCTGSEFFFEFVARNSHHLISGAERGVPSVSRECCGLLREATRAKAVPPHISIPVVFSYHCVCKEIVELYPETVGSSIQKMVENKVALFKRTRRILECRMVYEIYKTHPNKSWIVDKISDLFDDCAVKTYYLLAQVVRFECRDISRVVGRLKEEIHSYDTTSNRLVVKIYTLFLEAHRERRSGHRRRMRITNEEVLFGDGVCTEDIEGLELCFV